MVRLFALGSVTAAVAAMGTMWFLSRPQGAEAFAHCSATSVAGSDIGGPFELVNQKGATVTQDDVLTEPALIYFGYTYCPDVCPFDVTRNADAVDILEEGGMSVTPVFITIDPERDTVDVMSDYALNMHDRMIALTGSEDQVATASKAYKTYYKAHKNGTDEYLVDHSVLTYLHLPGHGVVEFFRRDVSPEQMAARTACFVENAS